MFSRENAASLLDSLAPMDFRDPPVRSKLMQAYCDYYGLNFDSVTRPVIHHMGYLDSGGFKIACQYFRIPVSEQRGTAFLVHGYFDHAGIYGHLVEHCLRRGFSVVIFDLPGHGLSSGVVASINSFQQYATTLLDCLALAQEQGVNSPWVIIGQSTGAAVIMDALLTNRLAEMHTFHAYILLAPLLRPRNWLRSRMLFLLTRWFLQATRRTFARNSHDTEFLDFLRHSDALQSTLLQRDWVLAMIEYHVRFARSPTSSQSLHVIQGSGDGTVDWQYNLPRILAKFPGSKSWMITHAGHHLVNESPPYRDRVFSAIDDILAAEIK